MKRKHIYKAIVAIAVALAFVMYSASAFPNFWTVGIASNSENIVDIETIAEPFAEADVSMVSATGNIIYVGGSGSGNYSTIQEGINAASTGDTVYVYNGTYCENVLVNKTVDLVGESRENVIVDGSGSGNVVYVTVHGVSIDTFTMTKGFYGIYLLGSSNNIMNCDVYRNKIHGVIIYNCNNNNIINCNFYDNSQHGIYLELASGNDITNCNSHNNAKDGFYIYASSSNNNVINCNSYNNSGIGIRVYLATYNNIINCTVHNNGGEGIGPSRAPYTNLMNCTVYSNSRGIYCQMSSDHISITKCNVYNNRYGIQITDTSYVNVLNCEVHDISDYGIYLFTATNCNIGGCNVYDNEGTGVYIFAFRGDTRNNIITECNLYNNSYGIRTNDYYGDIYDNLFYHNNFVDNTQNANDKYANTWDNGYPSGGNYWDDYTGEDNDGDGIGDTPYHIAGGINQDRYPFMDPNGWVNCPPNKPNRPSGSTNGKVGTGYTYFTNATDPDGDKVYYKWDWDDGTYSKWLGPFDSGETTTAFHSWSKADTYEIKVKAKDIHSAESSWSDTLSVHIDDIPVLEIGDISGGLFNINAVIKNNGSINAVGVDWRITLDGGFIVLGKETNGRIKNILAGESATIFSKAILGFGNTVVTVSAEIPESSDTKEVTAFVFLFFIKIIDPLIE